MPIGVNVVAKSLDLDRPTEALSQRVRAVDEDPSVRAVEALAAEALKASAHSNQAYLA